jgi:hypothetical protein
MLLVCRTAILQALPLPERTVHLFRSNRHILFFNTSSGSICNALGRLKTPTLAATGKYFIKGRTMKMRVSQTSILSKLPVKMQNQLISARKNAIYEQTMSIRNFADSRKRSPMPIGPDHFNHNQSLHQYKKMKFSPQQWSEIVRSSVDPVLDMKKEKVLYLEVPTPTVAVRVKCCVCLSPCVVLCCLVFAIALTPLLMAFISFSHCINTGTPCSHHRPSSSTSKLCTITHTLRTRTGT